jgi:hypothetical protein
MRCISISRPWLLVLAAAFFLPMRGDAVGKAELGGSTAGISGVWSDACSCAIPCPCWETGSANVRRCLNVQMFQPKTHDSSNGGATFVLIGNSEGYWAPSKYTLYVSNSADATLVSKLTDFFGSYYGVGPEDLRRVVINVETSAYTQRLEIPGVLHYSIESLPKTALSDSVSDHLCEFLLKPKQWKTHALTYQSETGTVIRYKGTSSLTAQFQIKPNTFK